MISPGYTSKNFYRKEGPDKPYRSGRHKMSLIRGDSFLMENYSEDGTKRQIMHLSGGISPSDDGINTARTGIRIYFNNGNVTGNYAIYGFKV